METEVKYGCHEQEETIEDDDDSLIDKCWVSKYKGDSRKWLIRDGSYKKPRGPVISCMKAAYPYHEIRKEESKNLGKRKSMLLEKFYDEASKEAIKESSPSPTVEDYCSEYDSNYQIPGFVVDEEPFNKHPELFEKYPLYGAMPTTLYSYNIQKNCPRKYIEGLTTLSDCRSPFKRSCGFTTPLSAKLEDKDY